MKHLGTKVNYFGIDIYITMPWVATDEDGDISCFLEKPEHEKDYWYSVIPMDCMANSITKVDLEGMDWKETLREYNLKEKH